MKTAFFDYYNRAIKEGLEPWSAYRWSLIEDIYDAEDNLLPKDFEHPEPLCFHPASAIEPNDPNGNRPWYGYCKSCDYPVLRYYTKSYEEFWWAPPVRLKRRSETAEEFFAIMAEIAESHDD